MGKMNFISGLPRSGSTLLGALLKQNPRFHSSMSSGLAPLLQANLQVMSAGAETSLLMDDTQKPKILRAICDAYYDGVVPDGVVFDTNRVWCAKMPLVQDLYPDAKVIACVRDIPWIMDSIERLYRSNPYENTRLYGGEESRSTVYRRVETLADPNRLVGYSWSAFKEAFYGEQAQNMLVVDYEYLAKAPEKVLRLIYQFIDEPWFDGHDFENVFFEADDFDRALGVKGLHRVHSKVEFKPRRTILPPDIFEKFSDMDFWKDVTGSGAFVITAKNEETVVNAVAV